MGYASLYDESFIKFDSSILASGQADYSNRSLQSQQVVFIHRDVSTRCTPYVSVTSRPVFRFVRHVQHAIARTTPLFLRNLGIFYSARTINYPQSSWHSSYIVKA